MPLQVRANLALPGSETLDFPDNSRKTRSFSPLLENHKHRGHDQHEPHQVVPLDGRVQVQDRKDREHGQRDHFLDRLQLHGAEFVRPKAAPAGTSNVRTTQKS
jgi:hypothetical protein